MPCCRANPTTHAHRKGAEAQPSRKQHAEGLLGKPFHRWPVASPCLSATQDCKRWRPRLNGGRCATDASAHLLRWHCCREVQGGAPAPPAVHPPRLVPAEVFRAVLWVATFRFDGPLHPTSVCKPIPDCHLARSCALCNCAYRFHKTRCDVTCLTATLAMDLQLRASGLYFPKHRHPRLAPVLMCHNGRFNPTSRLPPSRSKPAVAPHKVVTEAKNSAGGPVSCCCIAAHHAAG